MAHLRYATCEMCSAGVEEKMDALNKLKVKGLVLGPIHVADADKLSTLEFGEIVAEVGTLDQFKSLIHTAHKKGKLDLALPLVCLL